MIVGNRISLIPLTDACFDLTLRWVNDPELRHMTGSRFPVSRLEHERWFEARSTDPENKTYAIKLQETGELIGLVGNARYDRIHRLTEVFFYIGERELRGRGYGREAVALFSEFCFKEMNLHKICGFVYAYNAASRRVFEICGFVEEGVLTRHWYKNGAYHDVYVFGRINPDEGGVLG